VHQTRACLTLFPSSADTAGRAFQPSRSAAGVGRRRVQRLQRTPDHACEAVRLLSSLEQPNSARLRESWPSLEPEVLLHASGTRTSLCRFVRSRSLRVWTFESGDVSRDTVAEPSSFTARSNHRVLDSRDPYEAPAAAKSTAVKLCHRHRMIGFCDD
jgi:hypothetical protein